jgi:hypothetical protein
MSLTYTLNRTGQIIPPYTIPALMRRELDVAYWKDNVNVRLFK